MKKSLLPKIVWGVTFLLGLVGVAQRLVYGHKLAAYGSYVVWGLGVAVYIYFIGLSAGAFLLSSLIYVFDIKRLEKVGKLALFTALVTLLMALFSILFDIGHMERFLNVYTSPNFSSMMTWMVWLYTAYFILLLFEMWFVMRADLVVWSNKEGFPGTIAKLLTLGRRDISEVVLEREAKIVKVLATIGVPLAVAFHGGVGALFGVVGARPYWHSALYPILFLTGALVSGGALLTAIIAFFWPKKDEEYREIVAFMGKIVLGLLLLDLLLEGTEIFVPLWGGVPSHLIGIKLVLFGNYWWVFWIVHLLLGSLIPILMLAKWPRSVVRVGIASAVIAATFMSVRLNIVIPGLAYPEVKGLERAFVDHRLTFQYFPSLHEWLLALFVTSLGVALFYMGYKILPIVDKDEIVS
jgi:molybdopterin-containing oxidoreductase family membrane subunit